MAEYALIIAAVAIICLAGNETMGTTITLMMGTVATQL